MNSAKRRKLKEKVYALRGEVCFYCQRALPRSELTIDHFRPASKGGKNSLANLVPACGSCNQRKADKLPQKFL